MEVKTRSAKLEWRMEIKFVKADVKTKREVQTKEGGVKLKWKRNPKISLHN